MLQFLVDLASGFVFLFMILLGGIVAVAIYTVWYRVIEVAVEKRIKLFSTSRWITVIASILTVMTFIVMWFLGYYANHAN